MAWPSTTSRTREQPAALPSSLGSAAPARPRNRGNIHPESHANGTLAIDLRGSGGKLQIEGLSGLYSTPTRGYVVAAMDDKDPAPAPAPIPAPQPRTLGPVRAVVVAVVLMLVVNTVTLALTPSPSQGLRLRALHHLFQTGRTLFLGLILVSLVALARRVGLRGQRALAALAVTAMGLGALVLPDDLANFTGNAMPSAPRVAMAALVVAAALLIAAAGWVGERLGRSRVRWLAVAVGATGLLAYPLVLDKGYAGVHLFAALGTLVLVAAALAEWPLPRLWPRVVGALPWALAAALATFTVIVPPSNSLQLQLLLHEGDVVTPYLAIGDDEDVGSGEIPESWEQWFHPRDGALPIPPSQPPFVRGAPIVIFVTIDSLRADVLASRSHDKRLPNLAKLRDSSLEFVHARSPGSQTVTSLSTTFSGKYYSQMYWSRGGGFSLIWPWADETPRFPELLTNAGVATVHYGTVDWLSGAVGVVRGFTEDNYTKAVKGRFTLAAAIFPQLLARLESHADGPLFIYAHLLDAHHGARPRSRKSPSFERYLDNLALADDAIGELRAEIDRLGIADRTVLIVSSDHGEAFGEHGTVRHQQTLYEELLRIPLLIHGPGVAPRKIVVPVGLIDVGPTILDLFAVATPGHVMGESLVGFMRGKDPMLTRPLGAEGLLKRTLLFPDGVKGIVDERNRTIEVYDLVADPGELINLVDTDDPSALARIDVVRRFYSIHEYRRAGYKVPYRR
jgi:arylsulfatase A-like enzyme